MSTRASEYREAVDHLPPGGRLTLQDVPWEAYERLLAELEDRPGVRVAYDKGRMEIVSPRPEHEEVIQLIERLVFIVGEELDVDAEPRGAATWKKKPEKGAEADACYYVANAHRIIGRATIRLESDPPPDLVVEIDATRDSLDKLSIYAALGVPEIWQCDLKHRRVRMYALGDSGYEAIPASRAFGILTPDVLGRAIAESRRQGQRTVLAAFRKWVHSRLH